MSTKTSAVRDPQTRAEWQQAVDAAETFRLIASARVFGLVTGGPTIDVERCEEILARGRARAIVPARAAVDAYLRAIAAADVPRETSEKPDPFSEVRPTSEK